MWERAREQTLPLSGTLHCSEWVLGPTLSVSKGVAMIVGFSFTRKDHTKSAAQV